MKIAVTDTGLVEIDGTEYDPLDARGYALLLMKAADSALTQNARNHAFRQRTRS